jgi:hypothetical protein
MANCVPCEIKKKKQFFFRFELKNKTELIIMCFVPVSYNTIRHY